MPTRSNGTNMKSLWNDEDASQYAGDLAQRVYSSRLLGAEPSLVLHGGGNTSVKGRVTSTFGDEEDVVFVKGSGWDLATIEAAGFSPCRLNHLIRLSQLESLSDRQMSIELKKSLTDISAPAPSVEALLHAILPARFVDHTHADAFLTVSNTPHGEKRLREIYGDRVVLVPYTMPGFQLAKLGADLFRTQSGPHTIGMVLMGHGLFTFGETAKLSYERMIELVTCAEDYLKRCGAWSVPLAGPDGSGKPRTEAKAERTEIAALRRAMSDVAGGSLILSVHTDAEALSFTRRSDLHDIALRGPATPDHSIRTKRVPMLGRDVASYASDYRRYFAEHGDASLTMLDPAPRIILDGELGLCASGRTADDAIVAGDIYRHTMEIIARATVLGGWQPPTARDIFNVEYWDLEQAKLRKSGSPAPFTGEIAVVTGAASGIGRACVTSLLDRGAAVVGLDVSPDVRQSHDRNDYLGLECDVTSERQIRDALDEAVRAFGGVDILILNAGIFPKSCPIAELPSDAWRKTMDVNLDANLVLMRECHPLLKVSRGGGRVVIIGSKNVAAPGPGAASYSVSKAALQQLARVAALEWGKDGIRVNVIHPNAVFDTGIWTQEILAARAASYQMTAEEYKANNLLGVEITSRDVAELAAEMCGPVFSKTTAAQIPIDGGSERVI